MEIDVRRADRRFATTAPGRLTRHSFSFGAHYDPGNVAFGELVCHNDDRVEPGFGYADHSHRDLEIVTWVISGALTHRDASGRSGVITPGQVQVLSAGSGVVHAETVEPGAGTTRFVQTWVRPDQPGGTPSYAAAVVPAREGWVPVASGSRPDAAARIGTGSATLWVADARAGERLVLPEAGRVHLFVATGRARLGDVLLEEADAARLTSAGGEIEVSADAQLLVWAFDD